MSADRLVSTAAATNDSFQNMMINSNIDNKRNAKRSKSSFKPDVQEEELGKIHLQLNNVNDTDQNISDENSVIFII